MLFPSNLSSSTLEFILTVVFGFILFGVGLWLARRSRYILRKTIEEIQVPETPSEQVDTINQPTDISVKVRFVLPWYLKVFRVSDEVTVDIVKANQVLQTAQTQLVNQNESAQHEKVFNQKPFRRGEWAVDFWSGISTEFFGAVITGILINVIIFLSIASTAEQELKTQLIRDMGTSNNAAALRAVLDLRDEGWLIDGTLRDADLRGTDLKNADLSDADLSGVNLQFADLRGANLEGTNFEGANLSYALLSGVNTRDFFNIDDILVNRMNDLIGGGFSLDVMCETSILQSWDFAPRVSFKGADLRFVDFSGSDLSFSDFTDANLLDVDFRGANLYMADMTNAIVNDQFFALAFSLDPELINEVGTPPRFDRDTMLPDGKIGRDSRSLVEFVDTESDEFIDLSLYRQFALTEEEERESLGVAPLACPAPFKTIPYPTRQPGPFRPEFQEDE